MHWFRILSNSFTEHSSTMAQNIQHTDRLSAMHNLRENLMEIQRDQAPNIDAVARVRGIVKDADSMLVGNQRPMEILLDGQIFLGGQAIFRGAVQNLDTNLEPFTMDDFVNGITCFLEAASARPMDWKVLTSETYSIVKFSPPFDYRLGTLTLEPPPKPEKVAKERPAKSAKTEKAIVKQAEQTEAPDENVKEKSEHILMSLARCYRKNKNQAINCFKFLIDPNDFWRTIHNIYHCSHLVKDNMVKMTLVDGQPMLEPRKKKESGEPSASAAKCQFNFRLTPYEYRQLIKAFHITEALIPPLRS